MTTDHPRSMLREALATTTLIITVVLLPAGPAAAYYPFAPQAGPYYPGGWAPAPVYAAPQYRLPLRYPYRPGFVTRKPAAVPAAPDAAAIVPPEPEPREPEATPRQGHEAAEGAADTPRSTDKKADRHARFIARLRPVVARENARIAGLRDDVLAASATLDAGQSLAEADVDRLRTLARKYRVDGDPTADTEARRALIRKIDVIPVSLALAQAANESAWGTSRFAREGNNLFGIWTYDKDKGIVPRKRAAGAKHLVRKFDSIAESVRYYLFTLNSHPAYDDLRDIRAALRDAAQPLDGHALAAGLTAYSAKGEEYVRLIRAMIERIDVAGTDLPGGGQA